MSESLRKVTKSQANEQRALSSFLAVVCCSLLGFSLVGVAFVAIHDRPGTTAIFLMAAAMAAAVIACGVSLRSLRLSEKKSEVLNQALQDSSNNVDRLSVEADETNQIMQEVSAHFDELFRKIPAPCFCFDVEGRFKEWNKSFEDLTLLEPAKLINQCVSHFVTVGSDPARMDALIAAVFKGETFESIELLAVCSGGQTKAILCNAFPLRGYAGQVTAAICAGIDITERIRLEQRMLNHMEMLGAAQLQLEEQHLELVAANEKLEMLAMSDSLTGLKNHRALQERLTSDFKRSLRYSSPVSVLLIDVDRFKKYNDSYGHLAGDDVLREVSKVLLRCMRDTDFIARYGGEEFVAVLPHTDYLGSLEAAERLRAAVEAASWELIRVTVSIGVATVKPTMTQATDLIALADNALYHCKLHGRNQVCHAQDLADPSATASLEHHRPSADPDERRSISI